MISRSLSCGVIAAALCAVACSSNTTAEPQAPPHATQAPSAQPPVEGLPEPSDSHYGVYLNGHKVGWMRSQVIVGARVELVVQLRAAVGGMGTVSQIELSEHRFYNPDGGALMGLSFEQRAATGAVTVNGKVRDGKLHLEISAGNKVSKQVVEAADSLDAALVTVELAKEKKVGASRKVRRFDASILKVVEAEHRVAAVEERLFGGVKSQTVKIESSYPALAISESAWIDDTGTVLESRVGGFFVARLESPDVAKRLDYSQDLLISAVVKSPEPMGDTVAMKKLDLSFAGFGETLPPSSPRQQVTRKGELVELRLRRDVPPQLPLTPVGTDDPYVAATPFIQSDVARVQQTARRVIGDAKDIYTATSRLSAFVFSHVRDEYVPAYSNALDALDTGRGDCTEHSILFVALARSLGIPARVAVGIAYWGAGGGFGWHAWAEVRAGDRWYAVDPTWDQPIADATHVKLADGGPAEQARIVMLLGRLKIVSVSM